MNLQSFWVSLCVWMLTIHTLVAMPIVSSVSPTSGGLAGGNSITIKGSGFLGASNVDFGFRPASSYAVINDTTIEAVVPAGTVGTVDVTVTSLFVTSVTSPDDYYTYKTVGWNGIISATTPNDVTLFNTDTEIYTTDIVTNSVSLTSVIHPDGTFIYTANDAPPSISVIDAATYTIVDTIPLFAGTGSFDMVINPAGTRLYLSNLDSGFVSVIDTVSKVVIADIFVQLQLGPISITPDSSTVYVSSFLGNIYPIDTATNILLPFIPTPAYPGKVAITPDGTKAFVPISYSDEILSFDLPSFTQTNTIPLASFSWPYGACILPNSQTLYVANFLGNSVSVIDVATETLITTLPLPFALPGPTDTGWFWLCPTPDSKKVFVINEFYGATISIDTATNTVGTPFLRPDSQFQDLTLSPDPSPVAAFTFTPHAAGTPTVFDASASLSPIGSIVSYAWDFGDGNTLTTAASTVMHTYTSNGPFNVTLTVANSAGTSTTQVFSSGFMSNNGGAPARRTKTILAAPSHVTGFQKCCRFPSQTNIVNILKWTSPCTCSTYRIYRDAALTDLAGTAYSTSAKFVDPNRRKGVAYTYYIVAVSTNNETSIPAVVTIQPTCYPR